MHIYPIIPDSGSGRRVRRSSQSGVGEVVGTGWRVAPVSRGSVCRSRRVRCLGSAGWRQVPCVVAACSVGAAGRGSVSARDNGLYMGAILI